MVLQESSCVLTFIAASPSWPSDWPKKQRIRPDAPALPSGSSRFAPRAANPASRPIRVTIPRAWRAQHSSRFRATSVVWSAGAYATGFVSVGGCVLQQVVHDFIPNPCVTDVGQRSALQAFMDKVVACLSRNNFDITRYAYSRAPARFSYGGGREPLALHPQQEQNRHPPIFTLLLFLTA